MKTNIRILSVILVLLLSFSMVPFAVSAEDNAQESDQMYKDIVFDIGKGIVKRNDKEIILTKNEIIIFNLLLSNKDRIVTKDELMTDLWNNDEYINENALTVNISRLRSKLSDLGYEDIIETRKGIGYRIV